jgi:NTE family protein
MTPACRRAISISFVLFWVSACAQYSAVDKPLAKWTPDRSERELEQIQGDRDPDLLVLVAFSGGGSRASSLAYGVLEELNEIVISKGSESRTLLQEIDMVSSVSGGSFTAAYFALHGDKIFTDFESRFLRKNVEGALFWKLFNPINWARLLSQSYGRSDLAADYYDKILFDEATLSAFHKPSAPLTILNTTDLATGSRFPFMPQVLDIICADYGSYPVSRAVAASSAVPIVLSPITLESFSGQCDYESPEWVVNAAREETLTPRKQQAQKVQAYLDRKQRPWLHLVDGGISDNLGLRAYYDGLNIAVAPGSRAASQHHKLARNILIISVDARAHHDTKWQLERYAPSLFEVISSVSSDQISRYSEDTNTIVRETFSREAEAASTPDRKVTFHFVKVGFNQVKDDAEREYLNNIGTNFSLSDKEVDRLIAAGRKVLRDSPEIKAFLQDVEDRQAIR